MKEAGHSLEQVGMEVITQQDGALEVVITTRIIQTAVLWSTKPKSKGSPSTPIPTTCTELHQHDAIARMVLIHESIFRRDDVTAILEPQGTFRTSTGRSESSARGSEGRIQRERRTARTSCRWPTGHHQHPRLFGNGNSHCCGIDGCFKSNPRGLKLLAVLVIWAPPRNVGNSSPASKAKSPTN